MRAAQTMWAQVLTAPSTFETIETAKPVDPHQGFVVLRSLAGGVCGSDLPFFRGRPVPHLSGASLPPGFPLHEIVGEVVESAHPEHSPGDRVVGWATGQDGLAEYVVSHGSSLQTYAPGLAASTAVMLQPLACVLYAVEQLGPVEGRSVAVLGVGPIGGLFAHVLRMRSAGRVVGIDRVDRSDVAGVFHFDEVVHADGQVWAEGIADAERPDVVVEAIGHQVESLTSAVQALAYEGTVFYFGIPNDDVYPFPMTQFLRKNATLVSGVTAPGQRRRVLFEAEEYLSEHPDLADPYLTSRFGYAAATEAFESAICPRSGQMKVTLELE